MIDKTRDNPTHWRKQADKARAHAGNVSDLEIRQMMIDLAEKYDHLARRAEQRLRKVAKQKSRPQASPRRRTRGPQAKKAT